MDVLYIYMLKLAQAESDFGLKSQHDDTSQKTNLKTNPKVKLKLSIVVIALRAGLAGSVRFWVVSVFRRVGIKARWCFAVSVCGS